MDTVHPSTTGRGAFTIEEFSKAHGFSRAFFYVLKKKGKAPRITALGARRLITVEDALAWRQAMAEASAA